MDVVVGLDFTDTVTGLSLDVRVRTLALQQAEEFHGARDVTVVGWDTTPWSPLGLTAWPHFAQENRASRTKPGVRTEVPRICVTVPQSTQPLPAGTLNPPPIAIPPGRLREGATSYGYEAC